MLRKLIGWGLGVALLSGATASQATRTAIELPVTHTYATRSVAPTVISLPTISGIPVVGSTVAGGTGAWSQTNLRYASQWLRCSSFCKQIRGATGKTYTVATADKGSQLRFQVVASGHSGSTLADLESH